MVGAIRSERWAASDRNRWAAYVRIRMLAKALRPIYAAAGHFPTDDAANKLIWLALRNITADWGKAAHHWKEAMNQFAILYETASMRPADPLVHRYVTEDRHAQRP